MVVGADAAKAAPTAAAHTKAARPNVSDMISPLFLNTQPRRTRAGHDNFGNRIQKPACDC
jgi:hypothetical protein